MKNMFFILMLLSSLSCSLGVESDIREDVSASIIGIPEVSLETVDLNNGNLHIAYIDSAPFFDDYIEQEIVAYLMKSVVFKYEVDSILFTVNYVNRGGGTIVHGDFGHLEAEGIVAVRYQDAKGYEDLFNCLMKNPKGKTDVLILGYLYGYIVADNPKDNEFYMENIFELLYNCLLERKEGEFGENQQMLNRILEEAKNVPANSEGLVRKVIEIKGIIEESY